MRDRTVSRPKVGDRCYYCGKQATQVDHVVPKSVLQHLIDMQDIEITVDLLRTRALTVHSCRECNALASDSLQTSLTERKRFIKNKIRKRYRDVLAMPRWDDDELEELGYNLKSFVEGSIVQQETVKERLRW